MAKAKSDKASSARAPSKTKERAAAKEESSAQRKRGKERALDVEEKEALELAKRDEPDEEEADQEEQAGKDAEEAGSEGADEEEAGGQEEEDAAELALKEAVEGGDEGASPAQLGTERYVLAGFFAAGMLGAYIFGKFVHGVWAYLANKDWFSQALPTLTAVGDEEKTSISLVLGAVVALVTVLRTYRRPDVRTWSDDVAGELAKVKWPDRKEVYNATLVVIAASAIATIYLALLDRLWGFVTNLIYGDGS